MLLLASTLGLLGWRLFADDQKLAEKQMGDQRQAAAGQAVIALQRRIAEVERGLDEILADTTPSSVPPAGAVFIQIRERSIRAWPDDGLAFYPEVPGNVETLSPVFASADEREFKGDYSGAIAALKEFTAAGDSRIRASALAGIAGNQRKAGKLNEALETYAKLAEVGKTPVDGLPAALAGRLGALKVLDTLKQEDNVFAAARKLDHELRSGQWPLSRAAYKSLVSEVKRFLPEADEKPAESVALAESVLSLWERWQREGTGMASGHVSYGTPSGPVLVIWRTSGDMIAAFAAGAAWIESEWLADLRPEIEQRRARLVLIDPEGPLFGDGRVSGPNAIQLAADTGLPWTVQVFSTGEPGSRRGLMAFGMGVLLALILTGAWFVGHAVNRELAAARLQSDFVSVVSHEFRTPLTALCQLSELLKRGRMTTDDDRGQCYDFLYNESHRLRRLVESLLDFGRLESGKMQFRFEPIDAAALLRQSAEEFMEGRHEHGHHLEVAASAEPHIVQADRETLRCVFWNLFENAVKYSPDCDTVWVELSRNGKHLEIAVRDRGVGIPQSEQKRIFEKFVRGATVKASGIPGTGIGLATARQIVRAHGGDITLESEPARGSTFRVLLPLAATA
jgi:signal transduction histidine kinase